MSVAEVVLYSRSEKGHRGDYLRFLESLFATRRCPAAALPGAREPVLFLLIEDGFVLYVVIGLVRALMGRRTVGLLFRPRPALEGKSIRLRCKRWVLKRLRSVPLCQTLTIMPFAVDPRLAEIADGWIHDFQLWDFSPERRILRSGDRAGGGRLCAEIIDAAKGRKVVCALGRQDRDKGFDLFATTFAEHPGLRETCLFAFGGLVAGDLASNRIDFEAAGGFACDRWVDADELMQLYAAADLVWCCYAPEYDQASGILGRAAQLGIPVIVRRGTLLEALCRTEGIVHQVFDPEHPEDLLAAPGHDPDAGAALAQRSAADSTARLRLALGLAALSRSAR